MNEDITKGIGKIHLADHNYTSPKWGYAECSVISENLL
jgi:hypothetical protein